MVSITNEQGRSKVARSLTRRALGLGSAAVALGAPLIARPAVAAQVPAPAILLVRGDVVLPAATLAWRVVADVAEVGGGAVFEQRALGFAVNNAPFTSLLVTDAATGSAYRLAPGEAAFVRAGTEQRRESLGNGPESFLRVALVEATLAADAGGDRLLFTGPPFPISGGPFTLTLHRIALVAGEVAPITAKDARALILVEQGGVVVQDAMANESLVVAEIGSDTSYGFTTVAETFRLIGARDATTVLVAALTRGAPG